MTNPNPETVEEMRTWLAAKLRREVSVSQVKVKGETKFMVDYMNPRAPALSLLGESEDAAVKSLFLYLSSLSENKTDV